MPSHRMQHTCESIKRELTAIIRGLNDPRVRNNFIDLVKTDISKDMSVCSVYVSSIDGLLKAEEAVNGLNSAISHIKWELGKRLKLRFIPELRFIATNSIEYGMDMLKKINDLNTGDYKLKSLEAVVQLLEENNNFYIFAHKYPDGDAVGSSHALCRALQSIGKRAKVLMEDEVPQKYKFLEKYITQDEFEPQFLISVDIADVRQFGESLNKYSDKIDLCIDHHVTNKKYATDTFLDKSAASASEIIYELINEMGINIDKEIAECLYTGVSTDTGCFKYSNVTARTHRVAAELIEKDINLKEINRIFFDTKPKKFIKLEMLIYNSIEYFFDGRCAIVCVTPDMLKSCGIKENEFEGIASIPRSIEGVEIGITVREKGEEVYKISVRTSEKVNATEICEQFGGGGHICAAGFTFEGNLTDVRTKLLDYIEKNVYS